MMRTIGNHVQAGLVRGIVAQTGVSASDGQETILIVESMQSDDWASATFTGALHHLSLRLQGKAVTVADAVTKLAGLADREFEIAGQIVAEISASCGDMINIDDDIVAVSLTVNALTIFD